MFKTTRGLVLREVQYKEADRMLTILTEDEGKISAKARGALRTKSKTAAATQLLCFSDMTLLNMHGRWTVSEASELEQFRGLRCDLELFSLGSYIAELLEATSDEDYSDNEILRLGLNSLFALSSGAYPQELVKAAFELRLMCLSGYTPELSACQECGEILGDTAWFSPQMGEARCKKCATGAMLKLEPPVLEAMRYVISADLRRLFSFKLDAQSLAALAAVCESYAIAQLDRHFSTLDYYKNIRR